MEDYNNLCCTLCKNRCPINNRKCPNGMSEEEIRRNAANVQGRCTMCDKKCTYDALECSTGRTMARIKGWI